MQPSSKASPDTESLETHETEARTSDAGRSAPRPATGQRAAGHLHRAIGIPAVAAAVRYQAAVVRRS
jgi:hypothetical protein